MEGRCGRAGSWVQGLEEGCGVVGGSRWRGGVEEVGGYDREVDGCC